MIFFYSKNKAACVDVNQQTPPIREDPLHVKESSENEEENVVMDIDSNGRILERLLQRQKELERERETILKRLQNLQVKFDNIDEELCELKYLI